MLPQFATSTDPKSLLRAPEVMSRLDEMGPQSSFHRVIDESATIAANDQVRRVVLCSGKIYFDLVKARAEGGDDRVALVRVEQLYPFPTKALINELSRFKQAEIVWCQEEPRNMGSWFFVDTFIRWVLEQIGAKYKQPRYAGRPASAATATGLMSKHLAQLKQFLDEALG